MEGTIYKKNVDRNADNRQRTAANVNEHKVALEATGRTTKYIQEHRSSSPPFGPLRYYSLL